MKLLVTLCFLLVMTSTAVEGQNRKRTTRLTRAETKEAEQLLADRGYWTGPIDGVFDPATRFALMAFQKWEQRPVTGTLSPEEIEAIRTAVTPTPRDGDYEHAEVDIDRQVLLIVD